jgi:hypothetical protein
VLYRISMIKTKRTKAQTKKLESLMFHRLWRLGVEARVGNLVLDLPREGVGAAFGSGLDQRNSV